MTTRWERLAGDTSTFALKVAFAPDPDHGRGIDPDVGFSWGRFQIWVEGRNLCAHLEEGERVDSVHWYLLPVLEWFARCWDPLFHEERLPVENAGDAAWESLHATRFPSQAIEDDEEQASKWESTWQAWWFRHALHAASEGGLFPDIVFRRFRDLIEVSWGPIRSVGAPDHYEFMEAAPGVCRLPPRSVADPIHEVLSSAIGYLVSLAPDSRRIGALSADCRALGTAHADRREGRLGWLAGLGTDDRTARTGWRRVVDHLSDFAEAARRAMLDDVSDSALVITGSCHAALMFGSLAPDVKERDVLSLARVMVDLYSSEGGPDAIEGICRIVPVEDSALPDWSQGYELAEELHEHFRCRFLEAESVNIEQMLNTLSVRIEELDLGDDAVRGVAIAGPQHRPGIVVNMTCSANTHPQGRRFTLAHELCHLLFDRGAGRRLAVASGPWAPRAVERRANAFAAMLLMPTRIVQRAAATLSVPVDTVEGVREIASKLRVGRIAVLNHMKNLGFIDETDLQRIEDQVSWRGWSDPDDQRGAGSQR